MKNLSTYISIDFPVVALTNKKQHQNETLGTYVEWKFPRDVQLIICAFSKCASFTAKVGKYLIIIHVFSGIMNRGNSMTRQRLSMI